MVQIVNMSRDPRVVLPKTVPLSASMQAEAFFRMLCQEHGGNCDVLLNELIVLLDGERYAANRMVTADSRIYVLPVATAG